MYCDIIIAKFAGVLYLQVKAQSRHSLLLLQPAFEVVCKVVSRAYLCIYHVLNDLGARVPNSYAYCVDVIFNQEQVIHSKDTRIVCITK